MPDSIRPLHASVLNRRSPSPRTMQKIRLGDDTRRFVEEHAIAIFTDMTNSGATFQQCLASIYLSGCENALETMREK
jgi:hypothetical protein